jgi:hypothetical protein
VKLFLSDPVINNLAHLRGDGLELPHTLIIEIIQSLKADLFKEIYVMRKKSNIL